MRNSRTTSSFSLNSMHHGAVTARSLLQNTALLPKSLPRTTHHSPLLKLMPPRKRSSLRDSVSKASQHSSSSKTEKRLTTLEEEPQTLLSHGFSRSQDHHPPKLPVLPSRKRLKPTNSLSLTSVPNLMLSTLMLMLLMLTLRTRSHSFILMMPLVPLNTEPHPQELFSSENSRPLPTLTLVLLTKTPLFLSSSH